MGLLELLSDLEREPLELIEALREERERVADSPVLQRDLARAELRFLESCDRKGIYGEELRARVAEVRRAAHESELRCLGAAKAESAAALFDLAELRARVQTEQRAAEVDAEIGRRVDGLEEISERMREEARERYISLQTEEEDLALDTRIAMLRESARVFERLGEKFDDSEMSKLGRRTRRSMCDRILAQRLERMLTRRGSMILEVTSLMLLLVVFGLLAVELTWDISDQAKKTIVLVDASICVFFIAEFLFKLSLAPAKVSWFLRNAITDLLPAIPAALWFAVPTVGAEETVLFRALRLLRITWIARYVQALRPMLRLVRLLLFMAKGLDTLVIRFSPLLNRNFVFFEEAVLPRGRAEYEADDRLLSFRAQRREQVLLLDLDNDVALPVLTARAQRLRDLYLGLGPEARSDVEVVSAGILRDVPVEHAIEELYAMRPEEVGSLLPRNDLLALDRVVRILNAPLIRNLPFLSMVRIDKAVATAEERVVAFGKRIAALLERWRERALFFADLHGIVTGPQVLDRLATAMVKASFRPARNLILFGLFFVVVRFLVGPGTAVGLFLSKFVATPVLILGSVCAVVLALGFWLKRIAGEAADKFKLTSEAGFISLLELVKRRSQDDDLGFLAERVFRWDIERWRGAAFISHFVRSARTGVAPDHVDAPEGLSEEFYRVALLYLHYLDGAVLHASDVKTTEQLLANLSLENIRGEYLQHGRRDRKRLRKLSLQGGPLFGGPYLWFRCITESVAVETAKRVTDYNRNCLSTRQLEVATLEQRNAFAAWLRKRHRHEEGRLEQIEAPSSQSQFLTTEFNALDFLTADPLREQHIENVFGARVRQLLRADRKAMIREIFGTRPLHELPRAERTFNFYTFYRRKLSGGRIFLLPWHFLAMVGKSVASAVRKTVEIVREILAPQTALERRQSGRAPFAVALRKIHRMKAPSLLEAIRMRARFDPAYSGAPPGWSKGRGFEEVTELDRDMDFLQLHERDRESLREVAAANRRRVEELHMLVQQHEDRFDEEDEELRRRGERAVTVSYVTDRAEVRTLMRAEKWFETELVRMESKETALPARTFRRMFAALWRGFGRHPVDAWLRSHVAGRRVSRRGRRNFKRAWHDGDEALRKTVTAWCELGTDESPGVVGLARMQRIYRARDEVSRELAALRAVQSLSVLDVRNYRRLVFELGAYGDDGESPDLAEALP